MEELIEAVAKYGLDTVLLAVLVNLCTTLCKIPIKALARRAKNSANITRFIVFLPIVLGFVLTVCYCQWIARVGPFGGNFVRLWLSASSLSLTFYAVFEKLLPVPCDSATEREIAASQAVIDTVKDELTGTDRLEQPSVSEDGQDTQKIVLRGKKHETEE